MPIRRRTERRPLAAALATMLLAAACNPPAPTGAPTATPPSTQAPGGSPASPTAGASQEPPAQIYRSIRQAVESIRGLQPSADVDPVTIDAQQLRTNLTAEFDKENPADELAFSQDSLILLGLLPKGSSLRKLTLDFQAGQVAGYYSPDRKQLFVVSRSGGVGAPEEVTYAHEFTHQLTDQRFDLSRLGQDSANQSDLALAQLALVEGDAVSVQTTWTVQNLTPEQMGELLRASLDPAALEALRNAPPYLLQTSLFPYQDGLSFVTGLITRGGYATVDSAYASPPDSTEQVLHPEKYARRETPVEVRLPADIAAKMGPGWTEAGQDTLGEFLLRLWLSQNQVPQATAATAAAGWGGDRLVLLRGPSGAEALGLVTLWDSKADAAEFAGAAQSAIAPLGTVETTQLLSGGKAVVVTIGDASKKLLSLIGGPAALGQ